MFDLGRTDTFRLPAFSGLVRALYPVSRRLSIH